MKRAFTKVLAVALATALGSVSLSAQTVLWPSTAPADSNQVKLSQFAGVGFVVRDTNTNPASRLAWTTKGLHSDTLSKKDSATWEHRTGSIIGAFTNQAITTPTGANGAAVFNSDFLDTRGSGTGFGLGPAPAGHAGELVSPNLNLTGQSGVVLKFNQLFRRFAGRTFVTWSEDGGATWKPRIEANGSEVAVNAVATAAIKTIPLPGSVGTATFRVKFIFDGRDAYPGAAGLGFYYWAVDDVQILSGGSDIKIHRSAGPANYAVPGNQIEPMRFMAQVLNEGTMARDSVTLTARVLNTANLATPLYTGTISLGRINVGDTVRYRLLPGSWPATLSNVPVGVYRIEYILSGNAATPDISKTNDTVRYTFLVSDEQTANSLALNPARATPTYINDRATYANELGSEITTRPALTGNNSWRAGNVFYVRTLGTGTTATTFSHIIARVNNPGTPADANGINGQVVSARLYKWNDANGNGTIESTERTLLAAADSTIGANQPTGSDWYQFKLVDIATGNDYYKLTAPTDTGAYLAMVEYTTTSTTRHMRLGWATSTDWEPRLDASDSTRGTAYVRYGPVLGIGATDDWDPATFGTQIGRPNNPFVYAPCVRARVVPFIKTSDETVLPAEQKFSVFPNPADQFVNLRTDFATTESAIAVTISDISGREIKYFEFNNVSKEQFNINVSDFANGTYMLKVESAKGSRTEKFVVQH